MSIDVKNISKRFGNYEALRDVSLRIEKGELVALLGPSGSGKTTLLRIIAGLELPDSGSILLNEEEATHSTARERHVGFVFQHYALFRHMTVFENIAFGLRVRPAATRPLEWEIQDRVNKLLKLIQLDWLGQRYPSQLSGGQRQRVALARALAVEPRVLLLDEPFGALDAKVRKELRRWLRQLHDELHVASVFVTHDQEEALEVSDRVAIMNHGRIEQMGTPIEVYDNPASAFVYQFLGEVNLFHERVEPARADGLAAGFDGVGREYRPLQRAAGTVSYVRPHDLEISPSNETAPEGSVTANIRAISLAGAVVRVELLREDVPQAMDAEIATEQYRKLRLRVGDRVNVIPRNVRVFAKE